MGSFRLRAFADAAGVFNIKSEKSLTSSWFAWKFAANDDKPRASKFFSLEKWRVKLGGFETLILPPVAAEPFHSYFLTARSVPPVVIAPKIDVAPEIKTEEPRQILALNKPTQDLRELFRKETTLRPQAPAIVVAPAPAPAAEEPAKRKTLTLKAKVELPQIASLSRVSSTTDLAAAFKSEMKIVTERKAETADLAAAFLEKRRHPLSNKSWKELIDDAAAAAPKETRGMDLASAFKREMQAMLAAEAKTAAPAPSASTPAAPKPRAFAA